MLTRLLASKIKATRKSVLLLGPRQTGKTTLLKALQPDLTINLALESEFIDFLSDPSRLPAIIQSDQPKVIFIDEVQRIPSLLNTIQALIDEGKGLKFLLSGSSARKLKRGKANLLPGRVFTYQLGGLCAKEIGELNVGRALRFGTLPEPYLEKDDSTVKKLLQSYSSTYLTEEIQAEALARNLEGFVRFLYQMAAVSGQIVDFSKISTKAKVSRTSVVRFVEILEDTLVASRVLVFDQATSADTITHPKIYFFDVGILNGLLNNFEVSADRQGMLFEHLVFSQIRNSLLAHDLPPSISYFRTRHGLEVDFIVEINQKIWAIEVKSGEINSGDLAGLRGFRDYFPKVHGCIAISPRTRKRNIEGIIVCDLVSALDAMGIF